MNINILEITIDPLEASWMLCKHSVLNRFSFWCLRCADSWDVCYIHMRSDRVLLLWLSYCFQMTLYYSKQRTPFRLATEAFYSKFNYVELWPCFLLACQPMILQSDKQERATEKYEISMHHIHFILWVSRTLQLNNYDDVIKENMH